MLWQREAGNTGKLLIFFTVVIKREQVSPESGSSFSIEVKGESQEESIKYSGEGPDSNWCHEVSFRFYH